MRTEKEELYMISTLLAIETTAFYAISAAVIMAGAAIAGVLAMAKVIIKALESSARQPEMDSKIKATMILGMVFIETVVIYALVVAILLSIKLLG